MSLELGVGNKFRFKIEIRNLAGFAEEFTLTKEGHETLKKASTAAGSSPWLKNEDIILIKHKINLLNLHF